MTLGTAVLLLALAVAGIVLAFRYLREKPKLRIICLVLLSLIALVLVGVLVKKSGHKKYLFFDLFFKSGHESYFLRGCFFKKRHWQYFLPNFVFESRHSVPMP